MKIGIVLKISFKEVCKELFLIFFSAAQPWTGIKVVRVWSEDLGLEDFPLQGRRRSRNSLKALTHHLSPQDQVEKINSSHRFTR